MTMRRFLVVGLTTLLVGLMGIGTALGIVYGEPDDGEHPFVGSLVIRINTGELAGVYQWCSGTLMRGAGGAAGSDVFLTAGHCVVGLDALVEDIFGVPFEEADILVTVDEVISPGSNFFEVPFADVHWDPRFGTHGMADLFDMAVLDLNTSTGINQYGVLAPAGLLDDLKASGELKNQIFTAVGYGTVRETRKGGFAGILDNLQRNKGDQSFLSMTNAWITFSMNEATDNSGTCYGDSGGPHFLEGTNTLVSLTVTGDSVCKATDKTYRLDTASARSFLEDWVALSG
jgi:secreted trypsin-like serine protease